MPLRYAAALLIVASASPAAAQPLQLVIPSTAAQAGGNGNNSFPFASEIPSQRYQQVYAASEFAHLSGPHRITEIRFRPNQTSTFTPWSNEVMLDVRFSITQLGPDQLTTGFSENVGAGETVVYSGPAIISTMQSGPSGTVATPLEFDISIVFQTPLVYNPALGHLLMDIRREGSTLAAPMYLDAQTDFGDTVSRVYTGAAGTSASQFGVLSTLGLITMFILEPLTPPCYANCDSSTTPPILNVEDFTCFVSKFAEGIALPPAQQLTHYANCDNGTTHPVLNVEDFTCFITRFAAGCP
jgi:hypothetical protein